ncbi:TolC family protein, partial [Thermodesulfobacteriota bacterium]
GTGALSDVLNFKIRVNEAKTSLINSERVFTETMYGLAALLGAPQSRFPAKMKLARLKEETPEEMQKPDADSLAQMALEYRPDLKETRYALNQSEAQIKIAQSRFYPSVSLAASLDGNRTDDAGFESDDFGNTVGFNLTYNLFAGGLDKAKVSEARARTQELEKTLQSLELQVNSEVQISSTQVYTTQRQLVLQRANADLNQQNRDLVEKEYAAGQVSLVRLNEAQRDLTTAQGRLALALASLRQAWFNLETDTGRILKIFAK